MACNGLNLCGNNNNSCLWTLVIIAAVFVWLNCLGGWNCGCNGCNGCNECC